MLLVCRGNVTAPTVGPNTKLLQSVNIAIFSEGCKVILLTFFKVVPVIEELPYRTFSSPGKILKCFICYIVKFLLFKRPICIIRMITSKWDSLLSLHGWHLK